jgi:hypothetical protein
VNKNNYFECGDLVYYYPVEDIEDFDWEKKTAIIIKAKKLLKLYDILIQTENIIIKNVNFYSLEKATS